MTQALPPGQASVGRGRRPRRMRSTPPARESPPAEGPPRPAPETKEKRAGRRKGAKPAEQHLREGGGGAKGRRRSEGKDHAARRSFFCHRTPRRPFNQIPASICRGRCCRTVAVPFAPGGV